MLSCRLCHKKNVIKSYSVDGFTYYQCRNCQILFLHPQPSNKIIKAFYINEYKQEAALLRSKELIKRSKTIINKLLKLNPTSKAILDIGSGYGYLLNEARNHNLKVLGIEPSIFLYHHSVKNFKLPVLNNTLEKYIKKNKKRTFDFITLIHVIEHVPNPETFLNQVIKLLNSGGILYIETPNLDSHLFLSEKQNYTFLTPPDHLFVFSKKFFDLSINRKKLRCESVSTYSYPEHFMGIMKTYLKKSTSSSSIPLPPPIPPTSPKPSSNLIKKLKYLIFDLFLAKILYRFLNLNNKGSILELYYKKL